MRQRVRRRLACALRHSAWWLGLSLVLVLPVAGSAATAECRVPGLRHGVQCGVLERPLDPARPEGARIEVHYVVVPAVARRKLPDPVFVLAGGPGQSAIRLAPHWVALLERLGNRRDIVLVDQRGTGRSAPLECDQPRHEPLADMADTDLALRRARQCLQTLQALPYVGGPEGLRHFTTPVAMLDLDAVRERLGAQRINLVGASYGTRAVLDYQRQFPNRVRRAVLDGVAPPDMRLTESLGDDNAAAFAALLDACEADSSCARAYPSLRADWAFLLASLPRPVTLPHPLSGRAERFELTRAMVLGAVRAPLYSPALAAGLPGAISEAAQGRPVALFGLVAQQGAQEMTRLAMGMHYSVLCAEDLARPSDSDRSEASTGRTGSAGADFGAPARRLYEQVCASWPKGDLPAAFFRIARSDAPIWLLSGGLDPATPPHHALRVAQALGPLARHVVVPNAGHGLLALPCLREAMYRFIDAADDEAALAVDTGCAGTLPRPPVFRPIAPAEPARGPSS